MLPPSWSGEEGLSRDEQQPEPEPCNGFRQMRVTPALPKEPPAELLEKAASETAEVTDGREVMAEDYPRLKFLDAVVHEMLRLYPPLCTIGRSTIRGTMLGDFSVRSGTEVWIPIYLIHRDARCFFGARSIRPLPLERQ